MFQIDKQMLSGDISRKQEGECWEQGWYVDFIQSFLRKEFIGQMTFSSVSKRRRDWALLLSREKAACAKALRQACASRTAGILKQPVKKCRPARRGTGGVCPSTSVYACKIKIKSHSLL